MKIEIAKILHDEFDKAEQGLSVSFYTPAAFYRAGEATVTAAVVDVRYIGTFPLAKKQAVTRRIAAFLSERWDYDPLKTTVVFSEIESGNWGRKGGDFS
jgi:phenylpyruvate tautomerase PptA (4-oxalocrotonate tautomerase family)